MAAYNSIGKKMPSRERIRFKVWLIKKGSTPSQFAKQCGVSRQYMYQIINAQTPLTIKILDMFEENGFHIRIKKDL